MANTNYGFNSFVFNASGINNSAFGQSTMGQNVSGSNNAAFGAYAMDMNISGSRNIAVGTNALLYNTTGNDNFALGTATLMNNTASENVACGSNALENNTTGTENTAIGINASISNISGSDNTSIGYKTNYASSSLSGNTALGSMTAYHNTNGYNCTFLGAFTDVKSTVTNPLHTSTAIGYGAQITESNQIVLGTETETVLASQFKSPARDLKNELGLIDSSDYVPNTEWVQQAIMLRQEEMLEILKKAVGTEVYNLNVNNAGVVNIYLADFEIATFKLLMTRDITGFVISDTPGRSGVGEYTIYITPPDEGKTMSKLCGVKNNLYGDTFFAADSLWVMKLYKNKVPYYFQDPPPPVYLASFTNFT